MTVDIPRIGVALQHRRGRDDGDALRHVVDMQRGPRELG